MILLQVLMASGLLYAGIKTVRQLRDRGLSLRDNPNVAPQQAESTVSPATETKTDKLPTTQRHLVASSVSLGLASTGALLHLPVLSIASLPIMLYVFTPVFRTAGNKLIKENKVDDQVLIVSRVAVCVVMNYTVIAALDAFLHSTSQRVFALKEAEFKDDLRNTLPAPAHALLHDSLEKAAFDADNWQKKGKSQGEQMAPLMLAAFVLTLPLMGVNRAAAFLTTTFGSHLRNLGPYTARKSITQGAQEGILVLHPNALQQVSQLDTLLIDEQLWQAKPDWHTALKLQPVEAYLLTETSDHELVQLPNGVTGSFRTSAANNQQAIANRLQAAGKKVGYLSDGEEWLLGMPAFQLQLATDPAVDTQDTWDNPGIVLLGDHPEHLSQLWALASNHEAKQRFNLHTPTGCDLVDIGTTVFLDFGLFYSVLFTYTGISLSVGNTEKEQIKNLPKTKITEHSNKQLAED